MSVWRVHLITELHQQHKSVAHMRLDKFFPCFSPAYQSVNYMVPLDPPTKEAHLRLWIAAVKWNKKRTNLGCQLLRDGNYVTVGQNSPSGWTDSGFRAHRETDPQITCPHQAFHSLFSPVSMGGSCTSHYDLVLQNRSRQWEEMEQLLRGHSRQRALKLLVLPLNT